MVSYASEFYWNSDDVIYQRIGTERCSASGGFAWWMYLFKLKYSQVLIILNSIRNWSSMTSFDEVRQYWLIINHIKFGEHWMRTYEVMVFKSSKYTKL